MLLYKLSDENPNEALFGLMGCSMDGGAPTGDIWETKEIYLVRNVDGAFYITQAFLDACKKQ